MLTPPDGITWMSGNGPRSCETYPAPTVDAGEDFDRGGAQFPAGVQFSGGEATRVDRDASADAGRDDGGIRDGSDNVGGAQVEGGFGFRCFGDRPDADLEGVTEPFAEERKLLPDAGRAEGEFDAEHAAVLERLDDRRVVRGVAGPEDSHCPGLAEERGGCRARMPCRGFRGGAWKIPLRWKCCKAELAVHDGGACRRRALGVTSPCGWRPAQPPP